MLIPAFCYRTSDHPQSPSTNYFAKSSSSRCGPCSVSIHNLPPLFPTTRRGTTRAGPRACHGCHAPVCDTVTCTQSNVNDDEQRKSPDPLASSITPIHRIWREKLTMKAMFDTRQTQETIVLFLSPFLKYVCRRPRRKIVGPSE